MKNKILIIEDEKVLRDAYELILKIKGYDVHTARDGKDGLSQYEMQQPDLILLDLLMPVMSGKTFLRHWNKKSGHEQTKVVVYSNLFDAQTIKEVESLGVTRSVLKSSVTPNQLVAIVADMLEGDRAIISAET